MTNLNEYKPLIKAMLSELMMMKYEKLNEKFGSLTIKEMQKLSHDLYVDDICAEFGITKEQYEKDVETYEEMYYARIFE